MELIESDEPLSIYYCLDGQWHYRGIASLFVNMLFYKLSLSLRTRELQPTCLVMLDDAAELSYLPYVDTALSIGYGVRICFVMQNYKRMEAIIRWRRTITENCVHVCFTPNCDGDTAKEVSDLVGDNLMTPDEVLHLDMDKVIVYINGHKPILARKLRYYDNPWLKKICEEGE